MVRNPDLTIILGSPASGKTTLARRLSADLSLPCLCKDDIKEALFDVLGPGDRDWSRRLSEASFAALTRSRTRSSRPATRASSRGIGANRTPRRCAACSRPRGARAAQICCRADSQEIVRRFTSRTRHAGHLDATAGAERTRRRRRAAGGLPRSARGPRFVYDSDAPAAYERLLTELKSWRL